MPTTTPLPRGPIPYSTAVPMSSSARTWFVFHDAARVSNAALDRLDDSVGTVEAPNYATALTFARRRFRPTRGATVRVMSAESYAIALEERAALRRTRNATLIRIHKPGPPAGTRVRPPSPALPPT